MATDFDQRMMQRCLELARRALGQTAPNPLVGSVVVKDQQIVGEGFHPQAGEPHAEVFALRAAGDQAQGATVYVNLEPCSHYGRTPPCAEALIESGVAEVVVGMVDPNPKVSGTGIARLREAGINVTVGVEEAACQRLNEAFSHRIVQQRPFGILKYAMTLDGKIATTTGHSAWVTAPPARHWVHHLRVACDAVIIGGNTVRQDNPQLTARGLGRNPLRVVMSRRLNLPTAANLWRTEEAPTLVFTEALTPAMSRAESAVAESINPDSATTDSYTAVQAALTQQGVEVIALPNLSPAAVMAQLYERGLLSVLWECGGQLAAQAIADGSIQKVLAFIAPKIIGGTTSPSPVGDLGLTQMSDALTLERVQCQIIGSDYLLEGYLQPR